MDTDLAYTVIDHHLLNADASLRLLYTLFGEINSQMGISIDEYETERVDAVRMPQLISFIEKYLRRRLIYSVKKDTTAAIMRLASSLLGRKGFLEIDL